MQQQGRGGVNPWMRALVVWAGVAAFGLACGEKGPTEVGGGLLPDGAVRSYEVLLDPERYLVVDTSFAGYFEPNAAPYMVVAEDYEGALDAHAITQLRVPRAIAVRDTQGVTRSDSLAQFFTGRLVITLDTARIDGEQPIEFELHALAEPFDPASATWTMRVDTGDVSLPWTDPGGTTTSLVSTATWEGGTDSLIFEVDSATLALWRDTTTARGALIASATPDTRLRIGSLQLNADARPSIRQDTIVTVDITPTEFTFIFDPPIERTSSALRASGIPAWRTFLQLNKRLDTLSLPCAGGEVGCTVRLGDAAVAYAAFVLEPDGAPPGFLAEDSVQLLVREAIVSPSVPILRSPLGGVAGLMPRSLPAERFEADQPPVELPITEYMRAVVSDTTAGEAISDWLAILPVSEGARFGFVQFAPAPRLRLVITTTSQLDLR